MRFRIADRPKGMVYQLRFRESEVSVRYPTVKRQRTFNEQLIWTWPGGGEYSLVVPYGGNTPLAHIDSGEWRICSGRAVKLPREQQRTLRRGKSVPVLEWELHEHQRIILCEVRLLRWNTYPRWTLRLDDGTRLAVWRARCGGYEGVWSERLEENLVPMVAGIVLAQIHDWY